MNLIYLAVLIFLLFGCDQQPLINDYKIEGVSTGNSIKELLTNEKIEEFKNISKNIYKNKPNQDFFYVEYLENLKTYDRISLFSRTDDENYLIIGMYGTQKFINKNSCLEKQKKTAIEFTNTYKNTKKSSGEKIMDSSKGKFTYDYFDFPSGESIGIQCYMFNSGTITFNISIINSIDLIKWLEFGTEEVSD